MKTRLLLLAMTCLCVLAVSAKAGPFYQEGDPTGESAPEGKKMNFQGTLYENGLAVTGERSFTFIIPFEDGTEWTETHPNVQVVEGLYAVLLGSINPLPADLFFNAEERDLKISIGNTVLGTTQLLAPFGLNNGRDFGVAQFDLVVEDESDTAAITTRITGMGLKNFVPARAIHAVASTDSTNTAILSEVFGGPDNNSFQTAVRGVSNQDGTSWSTGVWGLGFGNGGGTTYGIRGEAYGEGNNFSAAARALNFVNSTDAPIRRYGGLFDTRVPQNAEGVVLGTSYGVAGIARGSEINYGVFGSVQGGEGTVNYAGYFQGDTRVRGTFFTTRDDGFGPELNDFSIMHRGSDGEVNAMLGSNWIDGGVNPDNRGALFLFADTTERFNRNGADIRRVELRARGDGFGGSTGALSLRSYDGEKIFAGIETFDGENYFSSLRLDGSTSNNFNFTASDFPNGNAPRMTMSGGLERTDEFDNVFIPELVNLSIDRFQDFNGNEEERAQLTLGSTNTGGMTTLSTEELVMRSNDYSRNFFSIGSRDNGEGGRNGFMSMQGNIQHDDGEGNTYFPSLLDLNIFRNSDTNEMASLNMNSTEGGSINLSPDNITLNRAGHQQFGVNSFDNGQGGRNVSLSMSGSLFIEDEFGNSFPRQLVSIGTNLFGEDAEQANMFLSSTDGASVNIDPTGIALNQPDFQIFSVNSFEDGNGGRNTSLNIFGGLSIEDEFGNSFPRQLVGINTGLHTEGVEQASMFLSSTDGSGVSLDPSSLSFNGPNGQPMSLSAFDNGFGRRSPVLRMQSGLEVQSEDGSFTFFPEMVSLGVNSFGEDFEDASLRLGTTRGASVDLSANGLTINENNYQPFALNTLDNGIGGRNVNLSMVGSLFLDDGFGNSFPRQLVGIGTGGFGEDDEQGSLSLSRATGASVSIDPQNISFNDGTGNQTMGWSAFDNGFGRLTPTLTMLSGLEQTDEFGNSFRQQLIRLSIDTQDENTDASSLSLGATDGRNVNIGRNGLNFGAEDYTPMALNIFDDGLGNLNASINLTGGIQRTDEGSDFSFNPELVRIAADRQSDTNEVGQISLSATDGANFGINAYGFTGTTNNLQTRAMGLISANENETLNMSTFDDGEGNELAAMRIRDVSNDFADLARIESVNEADIFGRLVLDKRNSSTDQFRIDANGVFGGSDVFQNGLALNYDGTGGAFLQMYANGVQNVLIEGNTGNMTLAGSLSQASDARLKKNVTTLTAGLAMVNQLRGVRYNWKDKNRTEDKVGFIAQEVEAVLPELVTTKKDGLKAVNYAEMTAVLVEAVKELSQEIAELKKENSSLKAELTKAEELESRLAKIEALLTMEESKETVKARQK